LFNTFKCFDTNNYNHITGYAFNACTIFKTALDYLRITGDLAFLDEKLADGKTVLERMDEIATDWQTLVLPDSPLANYGENGNLLECAPAYINRVASANAQNIWMMRETAKLQELKGNTLRAQTLDRDAQTLLPAVLSLYKAGDGIWYGLHNDGKRVDSSASKCQSIQPLIAQKNWGEVLIIISGFFGNKPAKKAMNIKLIKSMILKKKPLFAAIKVLTRIT